MATTAAIQIRRPASAAAGFAWGVLGFFILVVLWGAVVRATGSGGGCGSYWPLCNGDFVPHHPRLATIIEYAHRSTSGMCAALLTLLGFWTFTVTPKGDRARRAVMWAAFFLFMEALLGAALVLRHWVENNVSTGRVVAQSVHFTNTLLLMAAMALTAWFLREDAGSDRRRVIAAANRTQASTATALTAILATLVVGATGSLAALADTLFPSPSLRAGFAADLATGSPLLVRMRWVHPAAALIGLVCALLLVRAQKPWGLVGKTVVGLLGLQLLLGGADVLLLAPTWMQVLHLLGANLYWVALVILAADVLWPAPVQNGSPSIAPGGVR